ncbi:MAG: DUF3500 domain-containing protein [Pseudolabrys sp.]|nr:DUF3500 domain-containing protein [Pseudolabrys sp.]MDP2296147.1 DUF3500 domain-containing protein [Pseudolabrys sp.]
MPDRAAALPQPSRAPPRIDTNAVSKPLQDLFAGWHVALARRFTGLTANGAVEPGLFPLKKTGVNAKQISDAVAAFAASLDSEQRQAAAFPIDSEIWRTWSNIHRNLMRHGLCLVDLSETQRELAYGMMRACLGAQTYRTARDAMRLNTTLAELTGLPLEFGEHYYWISLFGEPSATAPWGFQIDGHHCNINCFVLGDQVVLSPILLGAEPIKADAGQYAGVTVLREEEARGWQFMAALTAEQRAQAIIGKDLPFDGFAAGFQDNAVLPYAGLASTAMTAAQRAQFADLIKLYTDRLAPEHAKVWHEQALAHLDRTFFGWIGDFNDTAPFYYRVHSPVIYIEFYHQPGVALPNAGYNRQHAHAMVRTPNGNDYGRELLRQYRGGLILAKRGNNALALPAMTLARSASS